MGPPPSQLLTMDDDELIFIVDGLQQMTIWDEAIITFPFYLPADEERDRDTMERYTGLDPWNIRKMKRLCRWRVALRLHDYDALETLLKRAKTIGTTWGVIVRQRLTYMRWQIFQSLKRAGYYRLWAKGAYICLKDDWGRIYRLYSLHDVRRFARLDGVSLEYRALTFPI
jgi:hypothetical protein